MGWEVDFLGTQAALRRAVANLLGGLEDDISLMTCTSTGLQAVTQGFPWEPGDEVVIPLGEFPSNRLPWLSLAKRGVTCREVSLWEGQGDGSGFRSPLPPADKDPEGRLIEALGPRTKILAASWVRFQDGLKLDLRRLGEACGQRGVFFVVDGIQGAGTCAVDLEGVSAFASGGHKGLLGPYGQGFLWTDRDFRQCLSPIGTWLSRPTVLSQGGTQMAVDDLWVRDGRRLEAGSPSILGCKALHDSLRTLLGPGIARIEHHVHRLQGRLLQLLRGSGVWDDEVGRLQSLLDAGRLGSILSFYFPESKLTGSSPVERLVAQGEVLGITASLREGYLRIAFHGWHSEEDVDRVACWMHSLR